jgi:hypothetical protein
MAKNTDFFKQNTHAVDLYHADLGELGQISMPLGFWL